MKLTIRGRFCRREIYISFPPYTPHTLSSVRGNEFRYSVLCFKNFYEPLTLSDTIISAKEYIEKAPTGFNIEALSKVVHISKYHLERKFKEQIGTTPYQFYISKKIKKIRQGLQSQLSLSDLAFDLGFSDQSHLCNTFKKYMGITPLQYACSYSQY